MTVHHKSGFKVIHINNCMLWSEYIQQLLATINLNCEKLKNI